MALLDTLNQKVSSLTGGVGATGSGYLASRLAAKDPMYGGSSKMPEDASAYGQSSSQTPATPTYTPPPVSTPTELASLGPTKTVAPPTGSPKSDDLMGRAAGTMGGATEPAPESGRDKMLRQFTETYDKLGQKGERTAQLQQEQGLEDKRAALTAANDRYNRVNERYQFRIDELRDTNPEGKSSYHLAADIDDLRRKQSRELGYIALDQLAAQGAVSDAEAMVKDLVAAEFEPLAQQLDALQTFNSLYNDDLSESEKIVLQGEIDRQQKSYDSLVSDAETTQASEAFLKTYESMGLDAVPDKYKAGVLALANQRGVSSAVEKATAEKSTEILDEITRLTGLTEGGSLSVSGSAIQRGFGEVVNMFGLGKGKDVEASVERVKALLSLDAIKAFKGLGPMSEREFAAAAAAASTLKLGMSEEAFNTELSRIQGHIEAAILPLPSTPEETKKEILGNQIERAAASRGESLSDDELIEMIDAAYETSFGGGQAMVGVGNVPQRNNNPGNLKTGGLADDLAVGTDEQGHLIFPDAATGTEALKRDLYAKISGGSQWLPANPTLAQLGKVYAEDPNWAKSVASLAGVSPSTRAGDIEFELLASAVMRQEGFFA